MHGAGGLPGHTGAVADQHHRPGPGHRRAVVGSTVPVPAVHRATLRCPRHGGTSVSDTRPSRSTAPTRAKGSLITGYRGNCTAWVRLCTRAINPAHTPDRPTR